MLTIAVRAATKAGDLIIKKAENIDDITITSKGKNDFVTEVDMQAEKEIFYHLQKAYPDHALLSEESGLIGNEDSEYLWIIDPLDGTNNFIHGLPHYCVSIALKHRGKIEVAVIYNPNLDQLFTASRGDGAQLNGKRLRASSRKSFQGCLFSASYGYNDQAFKPSYLDALREIKKDISGLRYSGSLALDLAYVSAGFYDAAWTTTSKPWDIAAASLLIKEAGGLVSEINGGINHLETGRLIAGNPKLVSKLIQSFAPHLV